MIPFRIFSVLAAIMLVGAVALGTLAPVDMSLHDALAHAAPDMLAAAQHAMSGRIGGFLWRHLVNPLLSRPLWLLPTSLGLVCIGAAFTCFPSPPGHTKHRRS